MPYLLRIITDTLSEKNVGIHKNENNKTYNGIIQCR